MKKYILLLFVLIICSGCEKKVLNCSMQLNEDGANTTVEVNYSFDFFGKQKNRDETINIVFDNQEDYNYYLTQVPTIYNNHSDHALNYTVSNDDDTKTITLNRNLILSNIDQNSFKELDPNPKVHQKKLLKYYKDLGYMCQL